MTSKERSSAAAELDVGSLVQYSFLDMMVEKPWMMEYFEAVLKFWTVKHVKPPNLFKSKPSANNDKHDGTDGILGDCSTRKFRTRVRIKHARSFVDLDGNHKNDHVDLYNLLKRSRVKYFTGVLVCQRKN